MKADTVYLFWKSKGALSTPPLYPDADITQRLSDS